MLYEYVEKLQLNIKFTTSLLSSVVLTLIAHGFNFFNATFANDRIAFFSEPPTNGAGTEVAGKWFAQYYDGIRGYSYLPWLIGVLSMIYLTLAVYITVDLLRIEKLLSIWIVAGLYTTNVSVITANLYGVDDFMFALVMAAFSAWFWNLKDRDYEGKFFVFCKKHMVIRLICSAICLALCVGVYGAYAPVAPVLIVLTCMVMLFKGERTGYVLCRFLEFIAMVGTGAVLYYLVQKLFLIIKDSQMQSYMGEDKILAGVDFAELISDIKLAFCNTINNWRGSYEGNSSYVSMPMWMAIALLVLGGMLFAMLIYKHRDIMVEKGRIVFLVILIGLFPLVAGSIFILAFGHAHYLMIFPFVYLYVAIAKMAECEISVGKIKKPHHFIRVLSTVTAILLFVFIYRGIKASNMVYSAMEMKYTRSQSIATRMIDRIESVDGYDGTEKVCLVGHIMEADYFRDPNVDSYWKSVVSGLGVATESTSFSHIGITPLFLKNIMGFYQPVEIYQSADHSDEEKNMISEMTTFPFDGSVEKVGDTIFVKLSDIDL